MMASIPGGVLEWGAGGLSVGLGIYGARLLGSAGRWLIVYFTGRHDKMQDHLDEGNRALIADLRKEVDRLKLDREVDRKDIESMREELKECNRKHAQSEAEVMQLKAQMQGYGDARQDAARIVAAEKREVK